MEYNADAYSKIILEAPEPGPAQPRPSLYEGMAGSVAARLQDLRKQSIRDGLTDYGPSGHRMERVAWVRGMEFINDSRATNLNACWYALAGMNRPVIWLAGGQEKGTDFSVLIPLVMQKVRALICLGADNSGLLQAFSGLLPAIHPAGDMEDAVGQAYAWGRRGDVVLLSPGCPSFDRYRDYHDRGRQFKRSVLNL